MNRYLTLLEARARREQITTSGMEIVTTFYCEPYTAAPIVITALLGGVTGNTVRSNRILPTADHDYPFCYCTSAQRSPMDNRASSHGPSLMPKPTGQDFWDAVAALKNPAVFDGQPMLGSKGEYSRPDDQRGACGAFIEATYRPLVTAYAGSDEKRKFDFVDPQFFPCSRSLDPGSGALVVVPVASSTPNLEPGANFQVGGTESLATESWREFTIRRIQCPRVPWDTIAKLTNAINKFDWKPKDALLPDLPSTTQTSNCFPARTLRYDGADVVKRIVPTCRNDSRDVMVDASDIPITAPETWYDITHKFSWRTTVDYLIDWAGKRSASRVYIPWTAVFAGPFSSLKSGWWGGVGWYDTAYISSDGAWPTLRPKYTYDTDVLGIDAFDLLFQLDSP